MLSNNDGLRALKKEISGCEITPLNKDLWQQFHSLGTEMIITKSGRRMFPSIRVQVSGLDPNSMYCVLLEMMPCSDVRYKYTASKGWQHAGPGEAQSPHRMYLHPESPSTGAQWMSQALSFGRLKLTNMSTAPIGHVVLNSMHRYQPRIIVLRANDARALAWAPSSSFIFPEMEFMAVTAYQNDKITKLKIDNNPFAKGFRDGGHCKRKKRSSEEVIELDVETIEVSSNSSNSYKTDVITSSPGSITSESGSRASESPDHQATESNKNAAVCISWRPTFWTNNNFYDYNWAYPPVEAFTPVPHYPYYGYPSPYIVPYIYNPKPQDLSTTPKRRKLTDFSIRNIIDS